MKKCYNRLRLRAGVGVDENLPTPTLTPTPVKITDSGRLRLRLRLRLRSPGLNGALLTTRPVALLTRLMHSTIKSSHDCLASF